MSYIFPKLSWRFGFVLALVVMLVWNVVFVSAQTAPAISFIGPDSLAGETPVPSAGEATEVRIMYYLELPCPPGGLTSRWVNVKSDGSFVSNHGSLPNKPEPEDSIRAEQRRSGKLGAGTGGRDAQADQAFRLPRSAAASSIPNQALTGLANAINAHINTLPADDAFTFRSNSQEGFWEKCPAASDVFREIKKRAEAEPGSIETVDPHKSIENTEIKISALPGGAGEDFVATLDEESTFDIAIEKEGEVVTGAAGEDVLTGEITGMPSVLAVVNTSPDILEIEILVRGEALIVPDSATVFTSRDGDSILATLAPGEPLYFVATGEPLAVRLNGEDLNVAQVLGRYGSAADLYSAAALASGYAGFGGELSEEPGFGRGSGGGASAIGGGLPSGASRLAPQTGGGDTSGAPRTFQQTIQGAAPGSQISPGAGALQGFMPIQRDERGQPVRFGGGEVVNVKR